MKEPASLVKSASFDTDPLATVVLLLVAEAAAEGDGDEGDLEDEDEELLLQKLALPLRHTYKRLRPSRSAM